MLNPLYKNFSANQYIQNGGSRGVVQSEVTTERMVGR
jgi:hypothetical protein